MSQEHSIHFNTFILTESDFSDKHQEEILDAIKHPQNRKTLQLIFMLIGWNIIALIIEWTILGGTIIAAVVNGVHWVYVLPEIAFLFTNFSIKSLWVKVFMKGYISMRNTFLSAIPSIGPFIILGKLVKDNVIMVQAVKEYTQYKKRYFIQKFFKKTRKNTS